MLELRDLTVGFSGQPATVARLNCSLADGSILGLAGASGVGKTMVARALAGVLPSTADISGTVLLDGRPVSPGQVILMVQHPQGALDPLRRIDRQLASVFAVHQRLKRADRERAVFGLLKEVGLTGWRSTAYPHQLSGGQCQRALIAMGLACRPRVLIADEPTSALDSLSARQILALLAELPGRYDDLGLILISHSSTALAISDHLVVLSEGRAVEQGETAQLLTNPCHPATRALIGVPPESRKPAGGGARLEVDRLSVRFDQHRGPSAGEAVTAVDQVSLTLTGGRTLALVGPSGCGKSSLARALVRLQPTTGGEVRLNDVDFDRLIESDRQAARRRVQIVFQDSATAFNPRHTVETVLCEALAGGSRSERSDRALKLLERVDLGAAVLGRYPHQLSGGQRQRVAIARALAPGPEVLICDEPVSSLDAGLRDHLLTLLDQLRSQDSLALLIISHDLGSVLPYADEVAVMDQGRIVETGPVDQVMAAPSADVTRALLAASSSLIGDVSNSRRNA